MSQNYLQSAEELSSDVYVTPTSEFELDPNQLLKLQKRSHTIDDSGEYWGRTLKNHPQKDLEMKPSVPVDALFFKRIGDELAGLFAPYVDDCLQAGTDKFCDHAK